MVSEMLNEGGGACPPGDTQGSHVTKCLILRNKNIWFMGGGNLNDFPRY